MYGFVYLTTNILNGKKYIGMCKLTHDSGYYGSGILIKAAIKKYGKENFQRQILQECSTLEELSEAEKHWIEYYDAVKNPQFYNLSPGGFGGNSDCLKAYWKKFSKTERKFAREWKGWKTTTSKNPMLGKKHSDETKKLIGSKSINRNWRKPNHFGKNNPKAKKVEIEYNGKKYLYDCLKDFCDDIKVIPYSTLKHIARCGYYSAKHNIKIQYV